MAQRIVDHTISPEELEAQKKASKKVDDVKVEDSGDESSKSTKPGKRKKTRSKQYKKVRGAIDKTKAYSIEEAIEIIKKSTFANFKESLELHTNLNVDPKNKEQKIDFELNGVKISTQKGQAIIHTKIGMMNDKPEELAANVSEIVKKIKENTPPKVKGKLISSAYLCATMSPSLRIVI